MISNFDNKFQFKLNSNYTYKHFLVISHRIEFFKIFQLTTIIKNNILYIEYYLST